MTITVENYIENAKLAENPNSHPPSIRFKDFTLRLGGRTILERVSFEIEPGSICSLLGESGSGKSAILRSINRLNDCIPNSETEGEILIGDKSIFRDIDALSPYYRRIGVITSKPHTYPLNIRDNIFYPDQSDYSRDGEKRDDILETVLKETNLFAELKDKLYRSTDDLSVSQKQRLCIARLLARKVNILLLDDPLVRKDGMSVWELERLLVKLKNRCTIILASRNFSTAEGIVDSKIAIRNGTVIGRIFSQFALRG